MQHQMTFQVIAFLSPACDFPKWSKNWSDAPSKASVSIQYSCKSRHFEIENRAIQWLVMKLDKWINFPVVPEIGIIPTLQ